MLAFQFIYYYGVLCCLVQVYFFFQVLIEFLLIVGILWQLWSTIVVSKIISLLQNIGRNILYQIIQLLNRIFYYRPSIGAELFMFDSGPGKGSEISISLGSHLSLTLCIQLKNVADHTLSSINQVYCIFSVSQSQTFSSPNAINFNPSITKEMVELNTKLLQYVKNVSRRVESVNIDELEVGLVESYASFEINGRGQGFGSCLLDISNFDEGLYQIKWHSGFVDEKGVYWSLLPLNAGIVFSIKKT